MDRDRPAVLPPPLPARLLPNGGSSVRKPPCQHDYDFLYSNYSMMEGPGLNYYEQKDTFFCRKCLAYETKLARTANERGRPSWYQGLRS
jgi:hypothetical protein